jgi:hypothetical protein
VAQGLPDKAADPDMESPTCVTVTLPLVDVPENDDVEVNCHVLSIEVELISCGGVLVMKYEPSGLLWPLITISQALEGKSKRTDPMKSEIIGAELKSWSKNVAR